jgi:adenylate cyclase
LHNLNKARKKGNSQMKKDTITDFLVPVIIGLLLIGLALSPAYHGIQWGLYDILLRLRPSIGEDPSITIVNIDDETIEELNVYPLTRDIIAQGLVTLTEFGSGVIGIDSEFIDKSPRAVRENIITQMIPDAILDTLLRLDDALDQLFAFYQRTGGITNELVSEVKILKSDKLNELYNISQQAVIDYDQLLGNTAFFAGNAHATITPAEYQIDGIDRLSDEQLATIDNRESKDQILTHIALKNIEVVEESPFLYADFISPAIPPVMEKVAAAGNVRQHVDPDGVRRRVDLLFNWEGGYFPHLGFSSVMFYLGYPKLMVYGDRVEIFLKETLFPPLAPDKLTILADTETMTIPLDESGRMIINWIPEPFVEQFRQLSFYDLVRYENDFADMLSDIIILYDKFDLWNDFWLYSPQELEAEWLYQLESGKLSDDPQFRWEYQDLRLYFLNTAAEYITTAFNDWENELKPQFNGIDITNVDQNTFELNGQSIVLDVELFELLAQDEIIPRLYSKLEEVLTLHGAIAEAVSNNLLIIGYSGKSTTDIGVNPFEQEYMNVGTMANVANMVLKNQFIDEVSWIWSFLLILPLSFLIPWMFKRLSPTRGAFAGIGLLLLISVAYWGLFVTTGLFLDLAMALLMVGFTFITTIIISFRRINTQKSFIRDAFGQYLSNDVINELLDNPDKLKLGGENRDVTAFFHGR